MRVIGCQFADFRPFPSAICRSAALALALILLCVAYSPRSAHAKIDGAEFAVDAFVEAARIGGTFLGVTIPRQAVDLVKDIVRCAVKDRSIADCARESVVKTALKNVPEEGQKLAACLSGGADFKKCGAELALDKIPAQARPMAQCLIEGKSVADCASKAVVGEIIARVPKEVQPMVQCAVETGDPQGCITKFAADQLPDGMAKDVVNCIRGGTAPETCAARTGINEVDEATKKDVQTVLDQLKQVKADTEDALKELTGSVYNIVQVAQGIEEGRYDKIANGAAPEIVKIVLTMIINAIVPVAAPITGPVVGALVDLYVETARKLVEMLATGDLSKVAEIVVEFYFSEMIARPCALIPDGGFKDATCGNLAKLIGAAAGVAGDVLDFVLDFTKKSLELVGLWQAGDAIFGFVGGVLEDIFGSGLEDPKVCGPANAFYTANFLPCMGAAAGSANPAGLADTMNKACVDNFKRCYKDPAGICTPMGSTFSNQVSQINAALAEGAETITKAALGAFLSGRSAELCTFGYSSKIDAAIAEFASSQCTDTLSKTRPLPVDACKFKASYVRRSAGHAVACSKAAGAGPARAAMMDQCAAHCRAHEANCKPPPVCTDWSGALVHQICLMEIPKWNPKIWEELFPRGNPIPPLVWNDPFVRWNDPGRRPGIRYGDDIANFVLDGGGIGLAMNDAGSRAAFVAGKCALRGATFNPVINYRPLASVNSVTRTDSQWLSLKTMSLVSASGFNSCSTGESGGGAYLAKATGSDTPSKKTSGPRLTKTNSGSTKAFENTGGAYLSSSPGGTSAMDRAGAAGAGGAAIGTVSGPNVGFVGSGPARPCPACGPKTSGGTKVGGTGSKSGGASGSSSSSGYDTVKPSTPSQPSGQTGANQLLKLNRPIARDVFAPPKWTPGDPK